MENYISRGNSNVIQFNTRVTAISQRADGAGMMVTATKNGMPGVQYHYPHVISTLPLPFLRSTNMASAGLSPMQANALRELNYGPAIKIGMQFKTAWWTLAKDKNGTPLNIVGGQSFTDQMLRMVVYPSFGHVREGETTMLIASYCWTEDASRFGALISNNARFPGENEFLRNLVLRELAAIHNAEEDFLHEQSIDTMAWSWEHDPYTMGV